MTLSEQFEEYLRRIEQYTLLQTNGQRPATLEERQLAEAQADEWLAQQAPTIHNQEHMPF